MTTRPRLDDIAGAVQGFVEQLWKQRDTRELRIPKYNTQVPSPKREAL